jgi:hypothetical protein
MILVKETYRAGIRFATAGALKRRAIRHNFKVRNCVAIWQFPGVISGHPVVGWLQLSG